MAYKFPQVEIIELYAIATAAQVDTRTSRRIPYPFILREYSITTNVSSATAYNLRIGYTKGGTDALATDKLFNDLQSNKSSKENNVYPSSQLIHRPNLVFPQPEYRFKAELNNTSAVTVAYNAVFVIEEFLEEYPYFKT